MKILGVVTARGGSKRLPNKNLAILGGKPLIAWSIEVGLATCNHVVTTTDSHQIAEVAAKLGSGVVMRPKELAEGEEGSSYRTVRHAAKNAPGGPYNTLLLLQPTSPFRTVADVKAAIEIMNSMSADSVISVVEFTTKGYLFGLGHAGRLRDYSHEEATYTPNGAIYLVKWEIAVEEGSDWCGPHAYAYVMPPERSLDIDTHADIDAARAMIDAGGKFVPYTNKKITSPL